MNRMLSLLVMGFIYSCGRLLNYTIHTLSLAGNDNFLNSLGVLFNRRNYGAPIVCVCVCVCVCLCVFEQTEPHGIKWNFNDM